MSSLIQHEKFYPSGALSSFIEYYFFPDVDGPSVLKDHAQGFTVMPSTHVRMVFFLGDVTYRAQGNLKTNTGTFTLNGFSTRSKTLFSLSPLRQVMVGFTPIGAQQFIDFSLSELTNTTASIQDVFPSDYNMLVDLLSEAPDNPERVNILERFFLKKVRSTRTVDSRIQPVLDYINRHDGTQSIGQVSKEIGVGTRTLQRLVQKHVGVNIKLFSKLVRFQKAKQLLAGTPQLSLIDIAYQLGYYDQAHFINDFSELSGFTPVAFRKAERSGVGKEFDSGKQKDKHVFL